MFFALAVFGPFVAPRDPAAIDLLHEYARPSSLFLLGTSDNGTDVLSIVLYGARSAALIGVLVVGLSLVVGTVLGALAGYRGGLIDHVVSGSADLVQTFPAVLLNIAILALVARPGLVHLILALSVGHWVLYARLARAQTLSLAASDFVQAARALGASDARILLRHIIPNLLGPQIVQATSGFGGVILAEATLSFLGLTSGARASWGALLDQGSAVLLRFPHVALSAGTCIGLTVLGFNLAGDWLRDRLDPKSR